MQSKFSRRIIAKSIAHKLLSEPKRQRHWLKVLAAYMLEQKMAEDVDLIVNDIAREICAQSGHLYVEVASARPLSEGIRAELKRLLARETGARHIELHTYADKNLIGGFVARTPDQQLDASVRTQLKQLASIN